MDSRSTQTFRRRRKRRGRKGSGEQGVGLYYEVKLTDRIAQYIEPLLVEAQDKPPSSKNIAVVAHGIFNTEFLGALLARLPKDEHPGYVARGE